MGWRKECYGIVFSFLPFLVSCASFDYRHFLSPIGKIE